jgi:hypothetical protein
MRTTRLSIKSVHEDYNHTTQKLAKNADFFCKVCVQT